MTEKADLTPHIVHDAPELCASVMAPPAPTVGVKEHTFILWLC